MLRFLPTAARIAGPALIAALLLSGSASAQTTSRSSGTRKAAPTRVTSTAKPVAAPLKEAAEGTYQLVRLTNKVKVSISSDALVEIERRRQDTDEVSWPITPYAKVRILPRRVINAPGFKPLEPIANAY